MSERAQKPAEESRAERTTPALELTEETLRDLDAPADDAVKGGSRSRA